jgi:hypothetical protein
MVSSRSPDRGQIMLIGAVAIAFIFLGLAAVYTAQISARPATTGSVGDQGAEATELNREARRNVRAIAIRVNHERPYYTSRAALRDRIRAETNDYSGLMAETYAGGQGASVNVSAGGGTGVGTRTTLYNDSTMTDGGSADWTVVDDSDIGWFVLNFNVTEMDNGESFVVYVENGTGASATYTFTRSSAGRSVMTVNVSATTGALGVGGTCNPRGNRSLIDLTSGESFTSDCSVQPAVDDLDGPYTVEFRNGDNGVGKFSVVTDDDASEWGTFNGLGTCPSASAEPCTTYAAWDVAVTARYESGRISYNNTQNVTVYEGV